MALLVSDWITAAAFWYLVFLFVASVIISLILGTNRVDNVLEHLVVYSVIAIVLVGFVWAGISYLFGQVAEAFR